MNTETKFGSNRQKTEEKIGPNCKLAIFFNYLAQNVP